MTTALKTLYGVTPNLQNIELQATSTHIQWRLVGSLSWINLMPLSAISGAQGKNIELQTTLSHIQWRLSGDSGWTNLLPLSAITGPQGKNIELQTTLSHIQWRLSGDSGWTNLLPLSTITGSQGQQGIQGIQGINGKNIELQTSATHIQWRLVGDSIWTNLIPLSDITGPQGLQGLQGIQGLPALPPADSWLYLFKGLTESDPGLEGASFPKTITLPPLLRQTTVTRLAGLINTLSSGTAIISIQHGISSFTTITGLSTLACTTSVLADQTATANNIIPAGNRIRILFTSITGTLNLSFRLDISEAL